MTSTNDGKDVNCKQSSGPRGKLYFIELYKFLDGRLSGEGGLQERTQHLCQAWECIHSLCLQSSPKLHLHLLGWLQTHTARTILHTEWQKPEILPQHAKLVEAIDVHIKEGKDAISKRNGSGLFWEIHLLKRAEWFKKVLSNPWGHPILKRLSNPTEEKPSDKEVIEWLREERSEMFVSRLRQLAMSKACADIAASLATAVMDRARASAATHEQDKDKMNKSEPTFADTLSREAGFNSEVWDLLTDLEFVLLYQGDNASRCIELAKQRSLRSGYKLVERMLGHVDKLPREKKLWKNAKKVAKLIAQVTITRCMVLPSCAGVVYDALYRCARSLAALIPPEGLPRAANALAAPAATAAHLHTLATAVAEKCKDEMKAFVCELYVRAITTGMNELERLKLKTEKASEARSTEQMLSTWFTQLGSLLSKSPRLNYECALTAFSVHPSPAMYERIVAAPPLPPLTTNNESPEASADTNSEFGSWATDSRTTTNFVKTSETLNIKQIQNNANVLSTAVLTEGEAIGLGTDLCQDLAVLLSGPRHKILSWDINRDVLLENCRTYMERTDGGTRALTTELKYLNLDPRSFQHLPFEKDDEDNIYYGIEKGYEHLVEHEEVETENQWQQVLFDSETEDAISSCIEDIDSSPVRRKKKKSKRLDSTDEEIDPLSLSDDQQNQKKKERPHSKERLKSKTKSSSKNKDSTEKFTSEKKEQKGERKERKKKDKTSLPETSIPLSSLIGMKVTRVEDISEKLEKQSEEQNQNRKLSIPSLNSDNSDNVVFDGLYSMDDISSPEKSNRSLQALYKESKLNDDLDDDNKPLSQVINEALINNQNKRKELRLNPVISPQTKYTHDKESNININYKDIPDQRDDTIVKESIKKLVEFRRLKNDSNIQPNTTSQLQSSIESSNAHKHSMVLPRKTAQDDSKEPCYVPSTSSPLHQNTPMNNANIKQFEHISPSTSEVRSILNGNPISSNNSGNLYVGRIVFGLAKYTSTLNEQKLKDNDTQSKLKTVSSVTKPEGRNVSHKVYSKRSPDKEKRIAQKQVLARNQPQYEKAKILNELQPQQQCDKLKSTKETKSSYKNFVDELKATINAGTIEDELYKDVPSSNTFPITNQNKLKIHSALTTQCAKSIVHQKITEAPNTFARLNYMHKNKQSHARPKATSTIKQMQETKLSTELDKQIVDHKIKKFHYLQTKDLTISRVGTGVHNRQSKDTPSMIQKKEVRTPLIVQKTGLDDPLTIQKRVISNSPNLTKDQSGVSNVIKSNDIKIPITVKTDAIEETIVVKNAKKHDGTIGTTKSSLLLEKDQQDILLLLRQQNKLNAQSPVTKSELKFKHAAQTSPQSKTDSKSFTHNAISNPRDLGGAGVQSLNDFKNENTVQKCESKTNTVISSSYQTHPSIIKMPISENKTMIYSSQSVSKSDGSCEVARTTQDVNSEIKMPVKRERHIQKKTSLDIETKSDWKLVMEDLLKHKTPSRGPNALDVALNKDSFQKHLANKEIDTEKAEKAEKVKRNEQAPKTSYGSNVDYQKVVPSDSIKKTVVTVPTTPTDLPKRISRPQEIQKTDMYYVPKTSLPDIPKNTCDVLNQDPFISGIPNSDYDILEELMDDDLRQEIGELISDDESLHYANVTDKKESQCSTIVTPFQKSFYDNTQTNVETICATVFQQDNTFATTNIVRNVTNTNLAQFPQPTSSLSSVGQAYSNIAVAGTIKMTRTDSIVQNISTTIASNKSPIGESQSSLHLSRASNDVYPRRESNVDSRNVIFTTIPPRTVVIGSETVYDPYHTMQIQGNQNAQVRSFNPNTYLNVNSMPNISFLPTTTFAAPPVVYGNTFTQTGTQNNIKDTLPNSTIQPMKYACKPNLNGADHSNQFIESRTTSSEIKNQIILKNPCSSPDVDLEINKNLILNRERNELHQVQVDKLSHTKNDSKSYPKVESLGDTDAMISSKENERLKEKRMALINREVTHYINLPPIPLPYMALNRKEEKSGNSSESKDDSVLNIKTPDEDFNENSSVEYSSNALLEKCKNDKNKTNDAESKESSNEIKNRYSGTLRRNRSPQIPSSYAMDKDKIILRKNNAIRNTKSKIKMTNAPLKGTSTVKHTKILKTNITNSLKKALKVRKSKASVIINYDQDNATQKLEHNTGIKDNLKINGNVSKKVETVQSINTFSIENEPFDIEDQLIGSVISKTKLSAPIKDIPAPKDIAVEINGKGEEKENDLNESQKVIKENQEANNIKPDSEVDEISFKHDFNEQKSNTDIVNSTKISNGKSYLRRLNKKKSTIKKLDDEPNDEIKTLKKVIGKEGSRKKTSTNSLLIKNYDLCEDKNIQKFLSTNNSSSIKQKKTVHNEVIDLDKVSDASVSPIKLTNLLPINNDDKLAKYKLQSHRLTHKNFTHKKRDQKNYSEIKYLNQVIFEEISSKKSKNKAHKAFRVVLPTGTKFKAIITGKKNYDVNNLKINSEVKYLLLKNFFNNKMTSSSKVLQKKSIRHSTKTNRILNNTNEVETIDLISDDEINTGVTLQTDSGNFFIRSSNEDFAKHRKKLTSKCFVSLTRYSTEELIALNRSIKDKGSCVIEESLSSGNEQFQDIKSDESEITKIPLPLSDKNVSETTLLENVCGNDNILNEQIDLVSGEIKIETTTDVIQNVPNTLIINDDSEIEFTSATTEEQNQDFHVPLKITQQYTYNFDCYLKLDRCDDLVKKYDVSKQKCYVELVRCDSSIKKESQIPHLLDEETSPVDETLLYNENESDNRLTNEDVAGYSNMNDDLIHPVVEEDEDKYESKIERSSSCSILTDFLICREIMDYTAIDKVQNFNNEQEGFVKLPVSFEVTCYAEWSMTKRDLFLQTANSNECIRQDPNMFDNNSPKYVAVSDIKDDTETENALSTIETLPIFQVQSLGKLALKFFESNSVLDLLYPLSQDTGKIAKDGNLLLKRRYQTPSCEKIAITEEVKNKPGALTDDNIDLNSPKPESGICDGDYSKDAKILNKTERTKIDVYNIDDIKLEKTAITNANANICKEISNSLNPTQNINDTLFSNINISEDICDNSVKFSQSQYKINFINTDHNYATTSMGVYNDLNHSNVTTEDEICLNSEERTTVTNKVNVVLGNIENSNVANDEVPEEAYDVLRNVTLVYQDNAEIVLNGIEYEDPIAGTCYMFPLESTTLFSDVVNEGDYFCNDKQGDDTNNDDNKVQIKSSTIVDVQSDESFTVIPPIKTYSKYKEENKNYSFDKLSKRGIKRKNSLDYKICGKRYRKSKNIDYLKASVVTQRNTAYGQEYKRLLNYYGSIKFSYTRSFDKEHINITDLHRAWPIKETYHVPSVTESSDIFKDNSESPCFPDPLKQTLEEELSSSYIEYPITSDDISETNFSMGFGEESGRVIQNLEKKDKTLKFSAATLSDVKQSQPFLMSNEYVDCENSNEVSNSSMEDQNIKLKPYTDYIQLKDKVRSYFKKTAMELKYNWMRDNLKDKDMMSNFNGDCNFTNCPLDLYLHDFIEPPPIETIVQVVQIGQLPVSTAAQNPVSCDPRVTQVANASPPQCSEENSSHEESQSPVKTEYTELTTADLSLPLVAEYNRHDCHKITESQEPAHLHNNQEILQSEYIYCKIDPKEDYNHEEVQDLSLRNKELRMLGKEDTNNSVYHYDPNVGNECPEIDTPTTFFESSNNENNNVSERTDQIAHAMNAAGIATTVEDSSECNFSDIMSEKLHQNNVDSTQNHIDSCSNAASINAVALQQALAQILPPPLNQTTSAESDAQTPSLAPQVLHIVHGKNDERNQITLVDNVQQSVINTPNAAPVLHIVQNKGPNTNASSNGTPVQQTNSFGALSLVESGLQQTNNQLLHIVNTGNTKDNNANQLLKRVNLLTNLANVQGSNEQKMLQFVCKSPDGKAIQLNAPHQGSMVLRLQPIEAQSVQDGLSNTEQLSPSPPVPSNVLVQENINTQQEIKSRSVYEENYAKFIQNTSSKCSPEKATSLPKFNQAFGKPVFQEENQKESEMNSNDAHLQPVNSIDDTSETSDNGMNLDHIGQISSPPLLLRKSPQNSQAQPSLVQHIKQSVTPTNTPMNIQTMHGGVIYTRQIPVNIGGGQTINLITVPSTELVDDSNHKQSDVKYVNQGEIVEPSIIKIVPQTTTTSDLSPDEPNHNTGTLNEGAQNTQTPPVLTQMRIKLPMLSKAPQMVSGTRVVRPSFFQIQRNVIGGTNQPVYQQLVLTAAPPLGQQTIRLPQTQMTRQIKVPNESPPESQLSSSTLEQLREFDMVLEQVKERSTVHPNSTAINSMSKPHTTTSSEANDSASAGPTATEPSQVLYSAGTNQQFNIAYVNRKSTVTTPTTSTFVRSPDSSVTESPTSSSHIQVSQTVTSATTSSSTSAQQSNPKPVKVSSRSRPRPKASSNPPNTLKLNNVPPKPSTQKPLEDEQTTQRILYILAEYREQVENCPDKNKPAPRRRTNPPSNPGSSKRKKSSSGSRRSGARDSSPIHGDDANRTMGSEDSSCGTSQGDYNENCLESPSPQDSPRKLPRKLSFENETPPAQPRPQLQRNVIVADGQTITVARGPTGKPATALLMPANYILPVSMLKGQQIAIVTNRGPKLLTVSGEGGTTGALLLQRLIGPAGLKPMLARTGVRHVRLPAAALHNLHAFNFATATTVQPPDSTISPPSATTPPGLVETGTAATPWTEKETQDVKPERTPSPAGSEPWNVPTSASTHEYTYEETVRTDNLDRTVLVVQKRDISTHRQHRLTHVTAAALRHKYAILEHELRLQKSLSEECEDLGVDSPSASELFPEAELLFAGSPAQQDHTQEPHPHRPHTPPPIIINQSMPRPDMDDQIASDHLLQRPDLQEETNSDLAMNLGLDDVGIVTVTENGATITLDHEEFARSHPNTTFHKEPTEETEMHPYTISEVKSRHVTSTIFHASRAPGTVLMGPQTTVISQASHDSPHIQHNVRYTHMENIINPPVAQQHNLNLSTVLVKDDGLTRYDSILTDSRELHLSNTASAIVHSVGNATQVIRRVGYDDDKRDPRFLMDDTDTLMDGDHAKMMGEDSSREALESMSGDVDYDRLSPERPPELYWESNSMMDRLESRRHMDYSSDSEKCCKSPPYDENNSMDSYGLMGPQVRLDSVIKDARGIDRSGSADGSSADDAMPPLRTYPAKRVYHHPGDRDPGRSLSGKTRAGERLDSMDVRRRASGRGVVKRCCHCCSGSPLPPRPKKPKPRKPTLDYNMH
ncbi:PREDICTED: uncharacterized protein LOC106123108 isoform X1 [Papilio xuthus]|uniref:Uncharacterized protein LOC106123108 isoform X1 n=1 Tax=Papilio xuthus TaxID=66420 RepID=A0AAJ6ZKR3_PAPXU|nr:PREDICTED: uncharacterized protein LOC106123108 isoform X1 [Papilio xuthus]